MMIAIPPKYVVSQLIGHIKGESAIHLARVYRDRKRNFVGQRFWAREFFVSTVVRDEEAVREYIRNKGTRRQALGPTGALVTGHRKVAPQDGDNLDGSLASMLGVHPAEAFQANLRNLQRRQIIGCGSLIVIAGKRTDLASIVHLDTGNAPVEESLSPKGLLSWSKMSMEDRHPCFVSKSDSTSKPRAC